MLDFIWSFVIILGILICFFKGDTISAAESITNGASSAVELCIFMAGTMSFWSGILNIAEKSGLTELMSKKISPIISFLFPDIPVNSKAFRYICINMTANFMGLGWAATPAGLMAMKEMNKLNKSIGTATKSMCMFIIINISSIQLLPINIIILRQKYMSISPFDIVLPSIIATSVSTLAAVISAKICERRYFK